ncbi:MAG: hypothetical protein A3F13_02755 [Gammaproteobacteria bacterium RIFCSPHIGHO2_12_FULL_40_19]|nr:MAG: hypothetical protein A3F13_02755 [Gammaproteobacteria bacterium RIFCSPHIGHO2_12_FULL_40_19]
MTDNWISRCTPPKYTGIYEVRYGHGGPVKAFFCGLTRGAWIRFPVRAEEQAMEQPTYWRPCSETMIGWEQ